MIISIALASLLVVPPLSSQEDWSGRFGDVVDVRVVNVEVVVTDRDGNRVFGLEPADFRLRVDGVEVPIEYFTEIQGGQATVAQDGDAPDPRLPVFGPGEIVGNSYLVFIDDFFAFESQRDQVLEQLREQLPNLRPEDRMAIVAFDGKNLELLTSWTGNLATLERAFRQAEQRRARGIERRIERETGNGGFGEGVLANRASRDQLERITGAVVSTLRSFAQPPGRKVMLLLSGGWPNGTFNGSGQPLLGELASDLDVTRPIYETANLVGYTLYPLDLPSFLGRVDRPTRNPIGQTLAALNSDNPLDRQRFSAPAGSAQESDLNRQSTLRVMAEETGGRALLFRDRLNALPRVVEDTRSYYWLGFTPDRQRDDARHEIEIEVLEPGLEARARQGFRDLSRRAEVGMMAQSALLFGNPAAVSALQVEIGAAQRKGLGKMTVPLRVGVPAGEVTVMPARDGYVAEVELTLVAKDASGAQSVIPTVSLSLTTTELPAAGEMLYYETSLKLRREPHDLVITVHDAASGNVLTSMASLAP